MPDTLPRPPSRPTRPRAARSSGVAILTALAISGGVGRAATLPGPAPQASIVVGDGDYIISPPYAPAPELIVREGVPRGAIHEFTMASGDSRIYPGIAKTQP